MTVEIIKKSDTAVIINGELIDLVQLWDQYNHTTYGAHSPFQILRRLEKIVEEGKFKFDYDIQFLLMYLVNWGFYIPSVCFKGSTMKFWEGLNSKGQRWVSNQSCSLEVMKEGRLIE